MQRTARSNPIWMLAKRVHFRGSILASQHENVEKCVLTLGILALFCTSKHPVLDHEIGQGDARWLAG